MDLHLTEAAPSDTERVAIDELLGAPRSGWDGGVRSAADHHVAFGGHHAATAARHLLLPALQAAQHEVGWVSPGALNYICERLGVPPAEAFREVFTALYSKVISPDVLNSLNDSLKSLGKGAVGAGEAGIKQAEELGKNVQKGAEGVTDKVKGIFGK